MVQAQYISYLLCQHLNLITVRSAALIIFTVHEH